MLGITCFFMNLLVVWLQCKRHCSERACDTPVQYCFAFFPTLLICNLLYSINMQTNTLYHIHNTPGGFQRDTVLCRSQHKVGLTNVLLFCITSKRI
uniref:G-protein coupled receptors family 1 profile domain-containing protein n=1 Tax=Anguilla anguilla TaxID=7936 RepID=A0A0E9W9P9_ANGAN